MRALTPTGAGAPDSSNSISARNAGNGGSLGMAKRNRFAHQRSGFDYLIVGAGFAGSVLAERLAAGLDKRVLLIDRRPHIAGNAYDHYNDAGILIHRYGPHIFHTNSQQVASYLSRFTKWRPYEHKVLADVDNDMAIARDELFGPVAVVIAYDDENDAVAVANDSEYGLAGAVWSADPVRASRVAARIRTGSVSINSAAPLDFGSPFGGFKKSGIGREGGPEGIAAYLESQSIIL